MPYIKDKRSSLRSPQRSSIDRYRNQLYIEKLLRVALSLKDGRFRIRTVNGKGVLV